ncbi:MAG: BBE domain-containing protein [Rhodobacteraceae bacterium]|nr:BBE domain-containing protein [Paracoccaceae bacterium]
MAIFDSRAPTVSDKIGFNRRFYAGNLEKVFTPTSDDELVAAVTQASTPEQAGEDPGVRIVSGRHCYENFVFNATSKSLIDCIGLDGVGQHPDRGYFVEAGASNWSSFTRLNALFGKCLPGGSCYSVGIGGHVSGGGYGLLSRLQGLTVDWVTGVDIVLTPAPGKAELHHVDAATEPELFWALKGAGGGNFGAISRFYFKELPDSLDTAAILTLAIPWQDIPDAEALGNLAESLYNFVPPDRMDWFGITKFNHQLKSGSEISGTIDFLVQLANAGIEDSGIEDAVAVLFRELSGSGFRIHKRPTSLYGQSVLGERLSLIGNTSSAQFFSFHDAVQTLNGSGSNQYSKYKSAYHKAVFSPEQFEPLFEGLTEYPTYDGEPVDMSSAWIQADSYGGEINSVDPAATPIWQRQSTMKLQYQCHWDSPAPISTPDTNLSDVYVDWIDRMYHAVYQDTGGWPDPYYNDDPDSSPYQGCYYNYCDNDLGTNEQGVGAIDFAMQMYFGKDNYSRLLDVKKQYDPHNIWNSAQSVPLRT